MSDVFQDYLNGAEALQPFLPGRPADLFVRTWGPPSWDRELVDQINARQEEIGGGGRVRGDEVAVVTGQQPGLLLGPLYTAYKAATAILAARELERRGVKAVPVFWLAGDDHDLEECATVHLLTKRHEPIELRYRPETPHGVSMNRLPMEDSLARLIAAAADAAEGSEKTPEVNKSLLLKARESLSFSDWCARTLAWLFADTPLVIFEPDLPRAREMAAPVIRRELENPLDASKEVNAQGARLERLGYDQQVRKGLHECSFFIERQGRRCKVTYRDGVYRLPEAKETLTRDEMSRLLDVEPEDFSPNVALRPLVQQSILPAAAYVAGPGEVAYWAQLGPLFERHRVQPPIVYPRARAVVTRDKERQLLDELSLRIADMTAPEEQLMDHALARMARNPARSVLERRRAPLEDYMESLRHDLREADDRGGQMAEALQRHASRQLDRMERAMRWADDVQVEAARKRVVRLQRVLAPWRRPQERVYTPYSFVFSWGRDFIERVLIEIDIHSFEMNEVRL